MTPFLLVATVTLYAAPMGGGEPFVVPDISPEACTAIVKRLPTEDKIIPHFIGQSSGFAVQVPAGTYASAECIDPKNDP